MLCYRDRTFCVSKCANIECKLRFTEGDKMRAQRWWNRNEPDIAKWREAPVSFADYKDAEYCIGYKEIK